MSQILKSWLYLATLSDLDREPVLIWPVFKATARSAIVTSSVSPLRWLMIEEKPFLVASWTVSIVSDKVPIWFNFTKMLFALCLSIPRLWQIGGASCRDR